MRRTGIETGRRRELWLALLVLSAAVLVPTALVLWFMGSAMRNARAAVRVQLDEAYQEQAFAASRQIEAHWAGRIAALDAAVHQPASRIFASCVSLADSAVVYDGARIAYPVREETAEPAADLGPEWAAAGRLEFEMNQPEAAAAAYAQIASESKEPRIRALALLAQARCLIRSGRKPEAMAALSILFRSTEYRTARDLSGRMIVPNAMLMALLGSDASSPAHAALAKQLAGRLSDYNEPAMPSSQRLFLMESLPPENRTPEIERYIAAEKLAAQYAEVSEPPPTPSSLTPTAIASVWQLGAAEGRLVALYWQERVLQESLAAALPEAKTNSRMLLRLFGPGGAAGASPTEISVVNVSAAENVLPGWRLSGFLSGRDPFAEAARREHALYLWTGVVGILLIFALALAITLHLAHQMRLTRLKNDLIATVSHELKTPLSSMRVLVDTLLEERCADRQQEQEYLRLIAGENQRLTRLIDNFLNFSRMERNRHALVLAEVKPAEIVRAAAESVRERFDAPHCRLELDLPPDLPAIIADRDALVTVMLNLLDNAWKYSGEEKEVSVRARAGDGELILTVQDNGIGLSPRQMRRIFEPFYQADRNLSRRGGGCGLGLSIVRFIVRAHGGEVEVASAPGKGSTFTVRLPLAGPAEEPEVSAHGS